MNAAGRIGLFAAGMVAVFVGSFALGSVLVPNDVASQWSVDEVSDHDGGGDSPVIDHEDTDSDEH